MNSIYYGDNLPILRDMPTESVDLIYIDPPFNTGKVQARTRLKTTLDSNGDRTGFKGQRYKTVKGDTSAFRDAFDDYLGFLEPCLIEGYRVLKAHGSFYFHIDYREVHYCKLLLDGIFGRECFLNEIVWAYDYGARTKKRWPAKHDNILLYAKDPECYTFNAEAIDRIPYMAPGLVGPEKAARGKLPTDTWWQTIVPPGGKESTGYATQKPLAILKRIVTASSNSGDTVLDFFAGSGTTGAAALQLGRKFILIDNNEQALQATAARFDGIPDIEFVGFDPSPYQTKLLLLERKEEYADEDRWPELQKAMADIRQHERNLADESLEQVRRIRANGPSMRAS